MPRAGYFDAVWICEGRVPGFPWSERSREGKVIESVQLACRIPHSEKALSIDPGLDNWLTCTTTEGQSFIVDGKHLKSLNQWYNKRVATIKKGKSQEFWCNLLDRITGKRNRQMRDAINKAARLIINHCLEHGIGTLVFGWNRGQKQRVGLDAKLIKSLSKCQQHGLSSVLSSFANCTAFS